MYVKSFVAVFACCICGCIDLRMESREDMLPDKSRVETISVSAEDFAGLNARLIQQEENRGIFSLVCTGRYQIVRRRIVDVERTGKHALSIGFLPGIYWGSEAVDGTDYSEWPLLSCKIILVNVVTAGVPTLFSLFAEPFDSYHDEKCPWWSATAGYGLIGCCKRSRWRPWTKRFKETHLETVTAPSYALSDYTIFVSGNPYHCEAGEKNVSVTIPPGSNVVSVEIKSVPVLKGELGSFVSALKNRELEVCVERR